MSSIPSGTVTFFFTDIEGSTRLAGSHPETWEELQARHHAILHEAIEENNGYVFQIIGDAFCVAFSTVGDAVRAAAKAQIDLHTEEWGNTPVQVRIGIHTGKANLRENGDYQGYLAMSRVQRVMSAGHGGQVLISAAAQELLLEDMPEDVSLRDLGEHRLKDLIRPEHIYQLVIPDLPDDFPPLKTLDAYPHNLPVQMTSFIGREEEIKEIQQALHEHRLVTLTGVGGIGKTSLSLQVAADMVGQFPDGVWLVELAPLSDPVLVAQAVATTLGLREQVGRDWLEMLKDYLSRKQLLLILDNCEHLIEACAQVADDLLHAAPNLKILATSREALGIAGEASHPVRSLSLPDVQNPLPETLNQYEAVQLFIDRAVAVQPNFQVTNQNAPAVAQICARLDGIPLAIELAAARVKGLSAQEIVSRLKDRFHLLTGGSRTALPRQRTLHATIDWSYKLLSEEERVLMRRLSVFASGWTLEAAEQVCAGDTLQSIQIIDLLLHLVDRSLVVADLDAAETRYHMLETIRQYAQEKLNEADEASALRDRHLKYFQALAAQAQPHLISSQQLVWLDRLEREYDNIRAALTWALEGGSVEAGIDLAADLAGGWFWVRREHRREGRDFLEQLLSKPQVADRIQVLAQGHLAVGYLLTYLSDYLAADRHLQQSESFWQQLGTASQAKLAEVRTWRLHTYVVLNYDHLAEDDRMRVRREYEENLKVFQQAGDLWMSAVTYSCMAGERYGSGDFKSARQAILQSLVLFREWGDYISVGEEIGLLGMIALDEANYAEARTQLEDALSVFRQMRTISDELLCMLGAIAIREGDYSSAKAWYSECLLLDLRIGVNHVVPECFVGFAGIAHAAKRFQRAAQLLGAAESEAEARKDSLGRYDQVEFERLTSALRQELGDETFDALIAKGHAMTLDQAIAFALEKDHA